MATLSLLVLLHCVKYWVFWSSCSVWNVVGAVTLGLPVLMHCVRCSGCCYTGPSGPYALCEMQWLLLHWALRIVWDTGAVVTLGLPVLMHCVRCSGCCYTGPSGPYALCEIQGLLHWAFQASCIV